MSAITFPKENTARSMLEGKLQPSQAEKLALSHLAYSILRSSNSSSKSSLPLFTGGALAVNDTAGDFNFLVRELPHRIFTDGQVLPLSSPAFNAIGTTSSFNAIQGAVGAYKAYLRLRDAAKIGDSAGKIESLLALGFTTTQMAGGIGFIGFRPLAVLSQIKNIDSSFQATTLIGKATCWTGALGVGFFAACFAFLSALFGFVAAKGAAVYHKLAGLENLEKQVEFLEECLKGNPDAVIEKLKNRNGKEINEAAEAFQSENHKKLIRFVLSDLQSKNGFFKQGDTEEETARKIGVLLHSLNERLSDDYFKKAILEEKGIHFSNSKNLRYALKQSGLQFLELVDKLEKAGQAKEAELMRRVGGACVEKIVKAHESLLGERLQSSNPVVKKEAIKEASNLISSIKRALSKSIALNSIICFAAILGLAGLVISFFFTGGVGAIIVAFLIVGCCVGMLIADGYLQHTGLKDPTPGVHDKKLVVANIVLGILSLAAVVAISFFFPISPLALAISLAIGTAWLVNNGIGLARIIKRDNAYRENHLTLEELIGKLKKGQVSEDLLKLLKKLPSFERKAIYEILGPKYKRISKESGMRSPYQEIDYAHQIIDLLEDAGSREIFLKAVLRCFDKNPHVELKELLAYIESGEHANAIRSRFSLMPKELRRSVQYAIWKLNSHAALEEASQDDVLQVAEKVLAARGSNYLFRKNEYRRPSLTMTALIDRLQHSPDDISVVRLVKRLGKEDRAKLYQDLDIEKDRRYISIHFNSLNEDPLQAGREILANVHSDRARRALTKTVEKLYLKDRENSELKSFLNLIERYAEGSEILKAFQALSLELQNNILKSLWKSQTKANIPFSKERILQATQKIQESNFKKLLNDLL